MRDEITRIVHEGRALPLRARMDFYNAETWRLIAAHPDETATILSLFTSAIAEAQAREAQRAA